MKYNIGDKLYDYKSSTGFLYCEVLDNDIKNNTYDILVISVLNSVIAGGINIEKKIMNNVMEELLINANKSSYYNNIPSDEARRYM